MKRILIVTAFVMGAVLLALILFLPPKRNLPRFIPAPADFKVPAFSDVQYPFFLPSPFEGGLAWIYVWKKSPGHSYLYDLEQKKVLGELVDGWPLFGNRDQSKVLLTGITPSLKEQLFRLLDRVTGGKFNFAARTRSESLMVLDRKQNKTKSLGRIYQFQGTASIWYPSPDYRYGFTRSAQQSGLAGEFDRYESRSRLSSAK